MSSALPLKEEITGSRNRSSKRLTLARLTLESGCSSSPWIVPFELRQDQLAKRAQQILWITPGASFENTLARRYYTAEELAAEEPDDPDAGMRVMMPGMPDAEIDPSTTANRDKIKFGAGPKSRGGPGATSAGGLKDQIGLHVSKMQQAGIAAYAGAPISSLMMSIRMMETLMGWPAGWASEERMPSE